LGAATCWRAVGAASDGVDGDLPKLPVKPASMVLAAAAADN
jgi:hypothetical protein